MKRKIVITLLALLLLSIATQAFLFLKKEMIVSEYKEIVSVYDKNLDLSTAAKFEESVKSLKKLIGVTVGRVGGKYWSYKDALFFIETLEKRVFSFSNAMCEKSGDKLTIHGHSIKDFYRSIVDGIIATGNHEIENKGHKTHLLYLQAKVALGAIHFEKTNICDSVR